MEGKLVNIEGKVAVITGGASGLGRSTAEMIIANGGKVAILDLNEDLAKATASELGEAKAALARQVKQGKLTVRWLCIRPSKIIRPDAAVMPAP